VLLLAFFFLCLLLLLLLYFLQPLFGVLQFFLVQAFLQAVYELLVELHYVFLLALERFLQVVVNHVFNHAFRISVLFVA